MSEFNAAPPKTSNRILSELPPEEYERLSPYLDPVRLSVGDILYYPHDPVTHVYFPNRGTLSIVSTFAAGGGVEVGVVGNEGVFGVNVVLGSVTTPLEALVQLPGDGLRIPADVIKKEFKADGLLQDLLLRYTQAFIIQIAQTAACNRSHPVGGRLARWLLMSHDRAMSDELQLRQDFISLMLGTRRPGINEAAGELQDAGAIRYNRGHVQIVDREQLEARSCECYAIVKNEFDRLLG
ncbi:MAG TPA: Crp/Fnr family transcriptional regulator [Pyrinomonadaceae bacterium]|jgi:CRP-like cAMP-binding protein